MRSLSVRCSFRRSSASRIGAVLASVVSLALPGAARSADIDVSFSNGTAVTASNVAAAIGVANGSFDSGDGRVAISSVLDSSIVGTGFNAVDDVATGEIGVRWGVEADHCLGAGGCGGGDHYVEATGDLVMTIVVDHTIGDWALEVGIQSYGNLNGLVDGGTLPACTSDMRAFSASLRTVGAGASATFDLRTGRLAANDTDDCTQDGDWVKTENAIVTVSGSGGGTYELHVEQDVDVRSVRQTNLFAIKNGSDTCFRAGMDPGDGVGFFDACDYPGLVFGDADRDADGLLGNEPDDGGIWITDRVTGAAVRVVQLDQGPVAVPVLGGFGVLALGGALAGQGVRSLRRRS